ncbi:hypothetical protein E1A91_D09G085300v1 [Gossypium mustelinum]|uniref:Lon N-terminal domain-containing protein n=1 Tax=Gossypium mustelinum TaxID=34275 RepID=A0A5D2TI38_GOSMU|nr:hypothetical protein E1A91_D09G085300v1 [Gossypium mustelinum]TYI64396.1 hypothetical protein E1A91_D09G085300v1 [Gossypium mustelinum]
MGHFLCHGHGLCTLARDTSKKVHFSPQLQTDPRQNYLHAKSCLQPSDTPASKTLSWHLSSGTKSTLKGTSQTLASNKITKPTIPASEVFQLVENEDNARAKSSAALFPASNELYHIGDFNFPRLADFGAAISAANKLQCQQVLEQLDVHKRLQLTLELVKNEMEISKIQESIAKAIEEKISGEQCRYLLNEQLKAIKKELGLETDDKTALSDCGGSYRD